jgi:hypothetical protein
LPYKIPDKFIGISANYGMIDNRGSFGFLEDFIECCNYQAGNGKSQEIDLSGEYWIKGDLAIISSIGFASIKSDFSTTITVPRSDGKFDYYSQYKFSLNETRNKLLAKLGVKYRVANSHFSVGGSCNFNFYLNSTATHKENILAPSNETFIDGSRERLIQNGILSNYNKLIFTPELFLNYDLSIARGYYTSLKIGVDFPVFSVIENEEWREWKISFGFSLLKSIE